MIRWFTLALVFVLGAVAGWTAVAIGAAKAETRPSAKTAAAAPAKADPELEKIRDLIAKKVPGIGRDRINPSPIPGLYEVQRGHLFGYVTADGRYLIQGDLMDLANGEEITENHRRADRLAAIKAMGDNYIEFAPSPPVQTKYTITVFTDVDCGYCRKLHSEIKDYNAQGIAVRYMFFPRTGPNTSSFYKAEEVWCSADRRDALTRAKLGQSLSAPQNCPNPVLKEYQLGVELGVRGTPAMVFPNGDLYPGYVPPRQLAALLAGKDEPDLAGAAEPAPELQ